MKKLDSNQIDILKEFYQEIILPGVKTSDSFDKLTDKEIEYLWNSLYFRRFVLSKTVKRLSDNLKIEIEKVNNSFLAFESRGINHFPAISDLRKLINRGEKIWKKKKSHR